MTVMPSYTTKDNADPIMLIFCIVMTLILVFVVAWNIYYIVLPWIWYNSITIIGCIVLGYSIWWARKQIIKKPDIIYQKEGVQNVIDVLVGSGMNYSEASLKVHNVIRGSTNKINNAEIINNIWWGK